MQAFKKIVKKLAIINNLLKNCINNQKYEVYDGQLTSKTIQYDKIIDYMS